MSGANRARGPGPGRGAAPTLLASSQPCSCIPYLIHSLTHSLTHSFLHHSSIVHATNSYLPLALGQGRAACGQRQGSRGPDSCAGCDGAGSRAGDSAPSRAAGLRSGRQRVWAPDQGKEAAWTVACAKVPRREGRQLGRGPCSGLEGSGGPLPGGGESKKINNWSHFKTELRLCLWVKIRMQTQTTGQWGGGL